MVDIFSSHHHEIAKNYSRINYDTRDWRKFYESLQFVFQIERELFDSKIIQARRDELKSRMLDELDRNERMMQSESIANALTTERSQSSVAQLFPQKAPAQSGSKFQYNGGKQFPRRGYTVIEEQFD